MRESEMLEPVKVYFDSLGFEPLEEYRIIGKRIDLLCVCRKNHKVVAIELKLRDWKGGLRQCIQNASFSNQAYLAMWHTHLDNVPEDLLSNHGIGLITVNDKGVAVVLEARKRQFDAISIVRLAEDTRLSESRKWQPVL